MRRDEDLDRWRKMTPSERARIQIDLMDLAWRFLLRLSPEERRRRLEVAREPWNPPAREGER